MDAEPVPQRDSTWTLYIVIFSLVTLLALWVNLSDAFSSASGKTKVPDRHDSLLNGDASAKVALALPLLGSDPTQEAHTAADYYRDCLPWPAAYRRLGLTKQVLLGKSGLADLRNVGGKKAVKGLTEPVLLRLRDEAKMWRAVYGPAPLTRSQACEFIPRVRRLNLGPLKRAAVAEVYARAQMANEANTALRQARVVAVVQLGFAVLLSLLALAAGAIGVSILIPFLVKNAALLKQAGPLTARPGVFFGGFTAYLVCAVLLSAGGAPGSPAASRMAGEMVLGTAAFFVGFHILRRLAARAESNIGGIGLRGVGWAKAIKWGVGGYCAALPVMGLALGVSYVLQITLLRNAATPQHPIVPDMLSGGLAAFLAMVTGAIVAPVIEETFFRGALYTGLRARMGVWGAAFFCGAFFAAIHPTLPLGFLPMLVLSVVLSLLREKTGSLYPAMICHALNNTLMLTLVLLIY